MTDESHPSVSALLLEALRPGYDGEQLSFGAFKVDDFERVLNVMSYREHGRILDLAGGFGRLARVLARAGHDVTVVEKQQSHIQKGQLHFRGEKQDVLDRVEWIVGDIRDPLDGLPLDWYSGVLLGHYSANEILTGLDLVVSNAAKHLEIEGRLFLDILPETPYAHMRELEPLLEHIEADGRTVWKAFTYCIPIDDVNQVHELIVIYERYVDGNMVFRHADSFRRRIWKFGEIDHIAKSEGLVLVERAEEGKYLTYQRQT